MSSEGKRGRSRWVVLAAYMGVLLVSQMLWLNFAPLLTLIQQRFGVSELVASGLVLVFPLLYLAVSVPAGATTDARGYRFTIATGAVVQAAGAALRLLDTSFWALLAGQIVVAIAQPFIVNAIPKVVADWFPDDEAAIANGLGTIGMFLGMAIALPATPALVDAAGLRGAMAVMFGASMLAALVFLALVRERAAAAPAATAALGVATMLRDRRLLLLSALSFLGLGCFNGLTTWLEPILAESGISPAEAGMIGGAMIVGGIVGAVVIPLLSDTSRRRRPFVLGCAIPAGFLVYPLCTMRSYGLLLALGAAFGFFLLPAFALLLAMSGEIAGGERAGAAASLLMLTGNGGAVVLTLLVPAAKGAGATYHPAVLMMAALLLITAALATRLPETFPRPESPGPAPAR